jgi:outer membrane cobalamin receptor
MLVSRAKLLDTAAIVFLVGLPCAVTAQQLDSTALEMDDISLEELLQTELTVATGKGKSLTLREAPGVVTLIRRDEIESSGARDLHDILRMVLGFELGSDIQGTTGYAVRGTWAQEGKVLLLVDGVQMNELLYGNPIMGSQMFVDHIEYIEVMRGPGSALYGGFAELAVVNIITRGAHDLEGASVSVTYGQMRGAYGRQTASLGIGKTLGGGLAVSLTSAVGRGHRSDQLYREANGESFPAEDFYGLEAYYVNLALEYRDLELRLIGDRHDIESSLSLPKADATEPMDTEFESRTVDAKYRFRPTTKLTILPRVTYSQIDSWRSDGPYERKHGYYYVLNTSRLVANLAVSYDPAPVLNLVAGGELFLDRGNFPDDPDRAALEYNFGKEGDKEILSVRYTNVSAFAQALLRTAPVNVTVGARLDKHSAFDMVFLPRVGVTKAVDRFHVKLLAGRSYRALTIDNLRYTEKLRRASGDTTAPIQPESTRSFEAEVGCQVSESVNVVMNAFDIVIDDVLVWDVGDPATFDDDGYRPVGSTGTRGLEAEFRMRAPGGYLTLGYTYARAKHDKERIIPQYEAKNDNGTTVSEVNFGFPAHKATLNASLKVAGGLTVNPSVVYLSRRYALALPGSPDPMTGLVSPVPREYDPTLLLNVNLLYRDAGVKGLDAALGVHDLLDTTFQYLPGYNTGEAPLPGPSREIVLRVSYHQPF